MYDVVNYAGMLDDVRVPAYSAALQAAITPGCTVVEVGTGIGAFAVMAVKMGARKVVAIEPSDSIAVARLVAFENGVADRIEFIQGLAKDVIMADKADVLVADLRGVLPLMGTGPESMADARDRLLKPGGVVIPAVDTLFSAVVETPRQFRRRRPACAFAGGAVDLTALRRFTSNVWGTAHFKVADLLTDAQPWAQIDYRTITNPGVNGTASMTVHRAGVGHGLAVWFEATLMEGVQFSTGPGHPETVYGMAFFPWSEPLELSEGDRVEVRFGALFNGVDYVWRWDSDVTGPSKASKARLRQSSFLGEPYIGKKLQKGGADTVAVLSAEGQIERFILAAMDGSAPNEQIAKQLAAAFPSAFVRDGESLARVGQVAQRFGRD